MTVEWVELLDNERVSMTLAKYKTLRAAHAALIELIECKDLKESGVRQDEYERRKIAAWAAARAAIKAEKS